jgi:tRNA (Thr-GGU) A37 N-methylase
MPPHRGGASSSVAVTAFAALVSAYALGAVTGTLLTRRGSEKITSSRADNRKAKRETKKNTNEKETNNSKHYDKAHPGDEWSPINLIPIGKVSSVYRLCVGTPRQGLLAPNCRGRIELSPALLSADSILGLDGYSHIWVVFVFHLNTNSRIVEQSAEAATAAGGAGGKKKGRGGSRQFPAKIAPPALGGKKVGLFSTRTPHRPNPIGLTLCKIDSISRGKDPSQPFFINVSGLDLVDGTPVLDIKPFVPHYDTVVDLEKIANHGGCVPNGVTLPPWVGSGLEKRREVTLTPVATTQLKNIVQNDGTALEFYGEHTGRDASRDASLKAVQGAIAQVLAIDVRSKWQTDKARKGKFQAEKAKRVKDVMDKDNATGTATADVHDDDVLCTQQLDNLLIKYSIRAPEETEKDDEVARGSGANDVVEVREIELLRSTGDNNAATKAKASSAQIAQMEMEDATMSDCSDGNDRDNSGPPKEFDVLKMYWSERGEAHTPKGLSPTASAKRLSADKASGRALTFSNRRSFTPPRLDGLSAVSKEEGLDIASKASPKS